ncbi:Succinate semialdehyde dehydrogenase [NAD(P)+] Sad [Piscirickettsia salmonis]|uniref:NAD-dependent succinate-semialdehyde dehydrogenase n=1 Tax=Piscirickettsia salmonis TaxID=1238 RepID=UPI0012B7B9F3|nr:NAD-dependent succinate-semialdehyde dehydrogenase [Piscirickettsia salmonis]QGP49767.1 Succinate semialdehyde dehydrogenase [NAD(P)+] Sad [Piscirickettsia salmonis]
MAILKVINPATGVLLHQYETMSREEILSIIDDAASARQRWERSSWRERKSLMHQLAALLRQEKAACARIITEEMGKPVTQAQAEIEKCAVLCEYYAESAEGQLQPELIDAGRVKSYRCYEPLGVIFGIMPWNFPFWQVLRFAVPNIMGANAVLLKHAPNSTGAALALEKLFVNAGFPKHLFRSLVIDVDLVSTVIEHEYVAGVTLTGSSRAGRAVGAQAAHALKKIVLELGGSDPYLILADADLDLAAEQCVTSRLNNTGQVCIAAKRIIAVDAIYDEFVGKVIECVKTYHCADPMRASTKMGPLARLDLLEQLDQQVQRSIAAGVKCILGGKRAEGEGYYYEPTILVDVKKGTPAYDEELFGPVVSILSAQDEAAAINIANDTPFGLGAAVFTRDIKRGEKIARDKIKAGTCAVNTLVVSDPRLPFGGIKQSGFGRELAAEGLHEFMNIKTVIID